MSFRVWVCIPTKTYKRAKRKERSWSHVLCLLALGLVCVVGTEQMRAPALSSNVFVGKGLVGFVLLRMSKLNFENM